MLGVRTGAENKCSCFFLSLFTGASFCLSFFLLTFFLLFSSFFYSCPPSSSFISSIFLIHLLHPLLPSPSSFSKESSSLDMSNTEAVIGDFEDKFTRHLTVHLSVLRLLLLLRQFTFCIGLFKPLFVRCNNFSY